MYLQIWIYILKYRTLYFITAFSYISGLIREVRYFWVEMPTLFSAQLKVHWNHQKLWCDRELRITDLVLQLSFTLFYIIKREKKLILHLPLSPKKTYKKLQGKDLLVLNKWMPYIAFTGIIIILTGNKYL